MSDTRISGSGGGEGGSEKGAATLSGNSTLIRNGRSGELERSLIAVVLFQKKI